jgi:hypothetical protein
MAEEAQKSNQNVSDYDKKMKDLQMKKAEAELQDLEERLAEREMKRENKRQRSVINGNTLRSIKSGKEAHQSLCNHRKGGNGADGIISGQGDDPQYSVLKHRMPNGDVWVRCLRCQKWWKPPVKSLFIVKDKFDEAGFTAAQREYTEAVAFQTRNQTSGSIQFRFSDGGEHFREVTKDADSN